MELGPKSKNKGELLKEFEGIDEIIGVEDDGLRRDVEALLKDGRLFANELSDEKVKGKFLEVFNDAAHHFEGPINYIDTFGNDNSEETGRRGFRKRLHKEKPEAWELLERQRIKINVINEAVSLPVSILSIINSPSLSERFKKDFKDLYEDFIRKHDEIREVALGHREQSYEVKAKTAKEHSLMVFDFLADLVALLEREVQSKKMAA